MAWWEERSFMKTVEKIASTVENAIESGLIELGIKRDQAKIEVLEAEGRRGFLGLFGMKMARVRISCIEEEVAANEDLGEMACQFLKEMVDAMEVEASFDIEEKNDEVTVNITGDDLGMLIGRRGDTLEAIQFWTNLALSKKMAERKRVTVDIEGYRRRREETLTRLAYKLADKAKKTGSRVALEPMNPQERRIIHMALQNDYTISTYSEGQEPSRRVVILPKRGKEKDSANGYSKNY
jgi:spoIIIJ-associated protein